MTPYVKSMIEEFPDKLSGKTKTPWNGNLFKVDPNSKRLETEQAKVFHTFVMKGMFLEIQIKYCPTEDMIADYMTKPLVGVKFEHFRKLIMNLSNTAITS
jgi:hypothetical protein